MIITLKNSNNGYDFSKHQFEYEILVVTRQDEIVFIDPSGAELGSVKLESMTDEQNKYMNGYFLIFDNKVKGRITPSNKESGIMFK